MVIVIQLQNIALVTQYAVKFLIRLAVLPRSDKDRFDSIRFILYK
jgi:hypothetical protein